MTVTGFAFDHLNWWNGLAAPETMQDFEDSIPRGNTIWAIAEDSMQTTDWADRTNLSDGNLNGV